MINNDKGLIGMAITNEEILALAQSVCNEDNVAVADVFPTGFRSTHLKFSRELDRRQTQLNDQTHRDNLQRVKIAIRDHFSSLPTEVQQALVAVRDAIIAERGDEPII